MPTLIVRGAEAEAGSALNRSIRDVPQSIRMPSVPKNITDSVVGVAAVIPAGGPPLLTAAGCAANTPLARRERYSMFAAPVPTEW